MEVKATLTQIRADGMQKWERDDLPKTDHMRYIWLNPHFSKPLAQIGSQGTLVFDKGTPMREGNGISIAGGHYALWRIKELA